MADFVSIHPEEWTGLVQGLYFSAMVSKTLPLFLPVVIFVLGLSLFIWLYRLERDGELTNFLLWLIVSSVLLISAFRTTTVKVELNPIVVVNRDAILNLKVKNDKKGGEGATQKGDTGGWAIPVDVSGASALLSIPDKIAGLFFNFLDTGFLRAVSGNAKTVPLEYNACMDPRYITATVHTLVLSEVFSLHGDSDQDISDFKDKVVSFKACYTHLFDNKLTVEKAANSLGFAYSGRVAVFKFSGEDFLKTIGKGVVLGGAVGSVLPFIGTGTGALIGGVIAVISFLSSQISVGGDTSCGKFLDAYKQLAQQFANQCDKNYLDGRMGKAKEDFVKTVLACVQNPETDKFCSDLREKTLSAIERAENLANTQTNLGTGPKKDALARGISDAKAWWYSLTYMDFPLKMKLLAKGQGIVLAILSAVFPFVVILSIIPIGRHFINWPLLLKVMVGYFVVKLWIPLLYFIINLASNTFGILATGG